MYQNRPSLAARRASVLVVVLPRAVGPKVTVRTDDSLISMATSVTVRTSTGLHEAEADVSNPNTDLVARGASLRAKFDALVSPILGADEACGLMEMLDNLRSRERIADALARTVPS